MTINGLGTPNWAYAAATSAQQPKGGDTVDFSKLPADLVEILKQGDGTLPSSDDIVHMAHDEQYFNLPTGQGDAFAAWHELTAGDKKLIKATTGWDMFADPYGKNASPDALTFAGRLNMDRYTDSHYRNTSGLNGGEVTEAYISKLISESASPQPDQAVVPLAILDKLQSYLAGQSR